MGDKKFDGLFDDINVDEILNDGNENNASVKSAGNDAAECDKCGKSKADGVSEDSRKDSRDGKHGGCGNVGNNGGVIPGRFGDVKNGRLILPIAFTAVFVVLCIVCFFLIGSGDDVTDVPDETEQSLNVGSNSGDAVALDGDERVYTDEVRGVWIASVSNINFPSGRGLGERQLMAEIDDILAQCADIGFNTVFFQVRPCADALYKSEIFPWSVFLSGEQGKAPENEFDCLEYLLKKAEDYGIEVHAWINPFRVTNGSAASPLHDVNILSENHPARLSPYLVIPYADGKLYFDPGNPEARKLIVSGIEELCVNYPDLAGIHIDDYFYPYPVTGAEFDDSASFEKYGAGLERDNWRRNNVNIFVKEVYDTVKKSGGDMKFGVSPFGIWANSGSDVPVNGSISSGLEAYSSLYCDALAWAKGGYVDYLVPQNYWSFSTSAAPFDNIARWWNANLDGTGVELYMGHAAYKAPDYRENEIAVQVEFSRSLLTCRGSIFYGYEDIKKNTAGVRDSIVKCFEMTDGDTVTNGDGIGLSINYPVTDTTVNASGYIMGVSDEAYPLTVDGEPVSRTKGGYFTLFRNFDYGSNTYEFKCGDENVTLDIKRVERPASASSGNTVMEKFEITSVTPDKPLWLVPGDVVAVSCVAPAGSRVYAVFGDNTVEMKPLYYRSDTAGDYRETYKGSVRVDRIYTQSSDEIADIGVITVYAEKGGRSAKVTAAEVKQMGGKVMVYAEVKNDYSYLKRSTVSSFYGDPLAQSVGMRDYITAFVNGYYRLGCGYYISENDVDVVFGKALSDNRILSADVSANIKDSSNNLANFTDIRFGVLENVPVDASVSDGKVTVSFFNTDAENIPDVNIRSNPMVVSGNGYADGGRVVYEFALKNVRNYYGFNIVYEDGFIVLRLNNPQSVKDGDKPLCGKTIVIDAGHGGDDIGAQGPTKAGSGFNESGLNLGISLELKAELESMGAKVIMTRSDDSTVTLDERIEFLAGIIPDLMISVHHNSVDDTVNASKARGYLGLYSNASGLLLAESVSDTVCFELSRYQRATAYQALAVARNHRFPSTLCEMSFISYPEEFSRTVADGSYKNSAKAIAKGILEFYERQEKYLNY